jgi:hypothetical protein
MREFDALIGYPEPKQPRYVHSKLRTIQSRIIASYRGHEFYEGDRNHGYGGLRDDGRWASIARSMVGEYALCENSVVLQIGCDKGFLLKELFQLFPTITLAGTEISDYAIECVAPSIKHLIQKASFCELPFADNSFDFIICIGAVYTLNLPDVIKCLKEIQRVGKGRSFITLGAYETEEDFRLFRHWSLLGCTILSKTEWIDVMRHVGYTGDYKFNTAQTLNLVEIKV